MIELNFLIIFVTSLAVSFGIIPLILRFATSYNLYDFPDQDSFSGGEARRVHRKPVPRLGGIGIVFGFFLSVLLWVSSEPVKSVYFGSFLLFLMGIIDDLHSLSARARFVIQLAIASFAVISGDLVLSEIWLTSNYSISIGYYFGALLSIFIIVGAINAVNLVDGLDGLAGGLALIGVVLIAMMHFLASKDHVLILAMAIPMAGSILGFLRYNTYPASIFMGDGGSNWLGFMIGAMMLIVAKGAALADVNPDLQIVKSHIHVSIVSILCCLSLPIVDAACVIATRFRRGQKPWNADKSHFHHTLLRIGMTHSRAVGAIYFLAVLVGIAGIMPVAYPTYGFFEFLPIVGMLSIFIIIAASLKIDRLPWIPRFRAFILESILERHSATREFLQNLLGFFSRYLIYGIFAIAPILVGAPPVTVGYAACASLLLLLLGMFSGTEDDFFQSLVISIASAVILTAINTNALQVDIMGARYSLQNFYNLAFILLFVNSVIFTLLSFNKNYLDLTPTDFLMVATPLLLLFVPEPFQTEYRLNIISLRSLVLFIAIRTHSKGRKGSLRRIRTILLFALLWIIMTSLLDLRFVY